jgi:hypothetical protein
MNKTCSLLALVLVSPALVAGQANLSSARHYTFSSEAKEDWHLKGEGVVCCPCTVPCPCRTNGAASYGHCEATLYLHVREGYYGAVDFGDLKVVNTSGPCAMSYQHLAALYFDDSAGVEHEIAFMKLLASFFPGQSVAFPYVRTVPINAQVTDGRLFRVSIAGILEMAVDRNWGQGEQPLPMVAATDHYSNLLQYVQNLRYSMHDADAGLDFNYSRRQANYRVVDLDAAQYRSKSMLVQFNDGKGDFNEDQLRLIREQHLPMPDLAAIRRQVARLR